MKVNVIMLCLGNICRSPMAEAILQKMVEDAGISDHITVDSAGTSSWHVGEPAHQGTRQILAQHGIPYEGRSRQITAQDYQAPHTYIIAMDQDNKDTLQRRFGNHPHFYRLLEFAQHTDLENVPDPYYHNNFAQVYTLIEDGCRGLLKFIRQDAGI